MEINKTLTLRTTTVNTSKERIILTQCKSTQGHTTSDKSSVLKPGVCSFFTQARISDNPEKTACFILFYHTPIRKLDLTSGRALPHFTQHR